MLKREHAPTNNAIDTGEPLEKFPRLDDVPQKWADRTFFDDASLTSASSLDEEEVEPAEKEVIEPSPFAKKMGEIPADKWRLYQIILGAVMGLIAGLSITFLGNLGGQYSTIGLIIAAVLALIAPNQLEKRAERKIPALRIAMIIALAATMGAYALYGTSTGLFAKPAA